MPKVFVLLVVKNEAQRYLYSVLNNLVDGVDGMFVYDDRSTDETRDVAKVFTHHVVMRSEGSPGFMDHEGMFREDAWAAFEGVMQPAEGDWCLSVDADEFLVSTQPIGDAIWANVAAAENNGEVAVMLPIPEVFGLADDVPLVRKDGLWATIQAPRLFRYETGGKFPDRGMGCGSHPTYVNDGAWRAADDLWLLHYGYARQEDQQAKYDRFVGLASHNHNQNHVESILHPPLLIPWDGPRPVV